MFKRVLVALLGIPFIIAVLFLLPSIYTTLCISIILVGASYEISQTLGQKHFRIRLYTMALSAAIPFWVYFGTIHQLALLGLFVYGLVVFLDAFCSKFTVRMELVAGTAFFAIFIGYAFSSIVRISLHPLNLFYMIVPFVIPFATDTFAMFAGMLFGKHKLVPSLSPKKTVEGAIGGLFGAVILMFAYGLLLSNFTEVEVNYGAFLLYSILGSVVSQIGDLSFSYIKRQNNIKDYSQLLPGHGGILDRFDSVIFSAPLVELMIHFYPALTA